MIVDYEYNNSSKNLIISHIDKSGNIKLKYYPWTSPTKFIATTHSDPEKHGKYVTWDGKPVKEIYTRYPNKYSIYDYLDSLPEEEQSIFDYNEPNIFFVDIENEILNEKPKPHLAQSKIQSISIVNKNKALVIGLDKLTDSEIKSIENDINNEYGKLFNRKWDFKYIRYKSEYDMMYNFFKVFVQKMPVITGWKFKDYDWVFLCNRARKLGIKPEVASLTGKLIEEKPYDPMNYVELPKHRIIIDYMEIFSKWDTSIKVKESDALDFVSEKVLNIKKVNYEGNLKILYETNFKKFIYYNAVDSILVQLIHEKMRYADILFSISSLSKITINTAMSTLAVTEGILRRKLKKQKNIVLIKNDDAYSDTDSPDDKETEKLVKGGWVKSPVVGMATWTCCYDFSSLYPTTIRQFKISADIYKGQQIKDTEYSLFSGKKVEIDSTDVITKNGAVFKNEDGVVVQVMADIFADRKSYKKKMIKKHIELEDLKKEKEELEKLLID